MKRFGSQVLCVCCALLAHSAQAQTPELLAALRCEPALGPGRILCELTSSAPSGKLVWADALVVRAPDFARPLRSRVVAQLGTAGPNLASAKLALVAAAVGQGELQVLARGVVCHEAATGEWCAPQLVAVSAKVLVGQAQPKAP